MSKDAIIFAQFVALAVVIPLYMASLSDANEAEQEAQRMYRMLPDAQQERMVEARESRQELLGDEPPADRY